MANEINVHPIVNLRKLESDENPYDNIGSQQNNKYNLIALSISSFKNFIIIFVAIFINDLVCDQ